MTSFIAWVGVDSRKPASVYLASDSRISWIDKPKGLEWTWDCGRKLFASAKYPELLGYYGSISFPSHILAQALDLIDRDLLFDENDKPDNKLKSIYSLIRRSFKEFPLKSRSDFTIVYCTREDKGMESEFHLAKIKWSSKKDWEKDWLPIPSQSKIILTSGSGKISVNQWIDKWSKTAEKGTSRSVFSAFCDSLNSGEDRFSGGAPQLVGLYRIGPGRTFGIIHQNKRFLFGLQVNKSNRLNEVSWHNSLFERVDWKTKKKLTNAQKHNRPSELENT